MCLSLFNTRTTFKVEHIMYLFKLLIDLHGHC